MRLVYDLAENTSVVSLSNDRITPLFEATVQAVEEAIINAMVAAESMEGINGNTSYRLPHDATVEVLKKYNRYQPKVILEDGLREKCLGKYELRPDYFITVFKEGDKLFAQATNRRKVEMTYAHGNTFDLFSFGGRIIFHEDDNQNISGLTLIYNGETKAKKTE